MTTTLNGRVQEYPCTSCGHEGGICWIVRHPDLYPPISYNTKEEALRELERLRAGQVDK